MKLEKLLENKSAFQCKMNGQWKDVDFPVKDLQELADALSDKPSNKITDQSWFTRWYKNEFVGATDGSRLDWEDIDIVEFKDDVLKLKLRFSIMTKNFDGTWKSGDSQTQELTILPE